MSTSAPSIPGAAHPVPAGTAIYHFLVLDSTNTFAQRMLQQRRPREGTIVVAAHQKAGRGQSGRSWYDSPGQNICLSRILYPRMPPQEQFLLNMAAALAVRDTILAFCPSDQLSIKWPNDVYVGDRKIAGILIQTNIQGNAITSCVAGIGINVFETDFPEDLPNPTSMRVERRLLAALPIPPAMRIPLRKFEVLDTLILHLARRFSQMEEDVQGLRTEYHAHLYRSGMRSIFTLTGSEDTRTGTITGVESDGHLSILWDNGEEGRYAHGEVSMLLPHVPG